MAKGHKAFTRLQEMILQKTDDDSLFAWKGPRLLESGMFALSPDSFLESGNIEPVSYGHLPIHRRRPSVMTNRGLEMDILSVPEDLYPLNIFDGYRHVALLRCARIRSPEEIFFIPLVAKDEDSYTTRSTKRLRPVSLGCIDKRLFDAKQRGYVDVKNATTQDYRRHEKPLFVLSPMNHGFSLHRLITNFSKERGLERREDLGGWLFTSFSPSDSYILIKFNSKAGGTFVLKWSRFKNRGKPEIYIPNWTDSVGDTNCEAKKLCKWQEFFRCTAKKDHSCLYSQAKSQISIDIKRKKLAGEVYRVIELNILPKSAAASVSPFSSSSMLGWNGRGEDEDEDNDYDGDEDDDGDDVNTVNCTA